MLSSIDINVRGVSVSDEMTDASGATSKQIVLYGPNGGGKTTVLDAIWRAVTSDALGVLASGVSRSTRAVYITPDRVRSHKCGRLALDEMAKFRSNFIDHPSGEFALVWMAGAVLMSEHTPDLVLIDEPEAHLSAAWQTHLMTKLRELSPNTQFIVATHSDEIIERVLTYERVMVTEWAAAK